MFTLITDCWRSEGPHSGFWESNGAALHFHLKHPVRLNFIGWKSKYHVFLQFPMWSLGFFIDLIRPVVHLALMSTQPTSEMGIEGISWGVKKTGT
jgi:hypothetical protein